MQLLNLNTMWCAGPSKLDVSNDMLHLWRANLAQPTQKISELHNALSVDEKRKADRFLFKRHKCNYIVARGFLRTILSHYLELGPASLRFSYGEYGKPQLLSKYSNCQLQFNLSHTEEFAIYAIAYQRRIGVDIEFINPKKKIDRLLDSILSQTEQSKTNKLSESNRRLEFYKAWTAMEAYLKATGQGLTGMNSIDISITPGETAKLLTSIKKCQPSTTWSLCHMMAVHDYVASLVVEGPHCVITATYNAY